MFTYVNFCQFHLWNQNQQLNIALCFPATWLSHYTSSDIEYNNNHYLRKMEKNLVNNIVHLKKHIHTFTKLLGETTTALLIIGIPVGL